MNDGDERAPGSRSASGPEGAGAAAGPLGEEPYEVFARKKRGDALRHVGCVDAPGEALARVYAWKTYDEESWFEMCVVPRRAIVRAGPGAGPAESPVGGRGPADPARETGARR